MTLDELVVSLVLDSSGFRKGTKEVSEATDKLKTETVKQGARIEGALAKVNERFEGMVRVALAAVAVFAGARSVEDFTRKITALDVAIGRLSGSMGQSPSDVSAIAKAVERMGGSADAAMSGLRGLSDAFMQLQTTGSTAIMRPLAQLQALSGKAITFGKDVKENYLSIADALQAEQKKNPAMANFLGRQIFGSDDLANLAMQGRAANLAAMAESRKHGVVSPEDVEAAQKLTDAYNSLSQTVVGLGQKVVTALSPYLTDLLRQLDAIIQKNKDWIATAVAEYVQKFGQWIADHKDDIKAFADKLGQVAEVAGSIAVAFSKQSPTMMALEGLAFMFGTRLVGAINLAMGAMRALAALGGGSLLAGLGSLLGIGVVVGGASYLANNTRDEQADNGFPMTAGERAMRFVDPGLADRVYGKRGEQQPHGPHHGLGVQHQTTEQKRDGIWNRAKRALGFGSGESDSTHVNPAGPRARGGANPNMTPENAAAIVSAAKDLGTTPEDLATVIGYETAGSYSPKKWGGAGGQYMGLIQFGPPERAKYGADDQQTFPQQMEAVKRYLKDRGFKPGMGLMDLYSTINAGSPGHYNASDGNGTVRTHVARMQLEQAPYARAFVGMAPGTGTPAPSAAPSAAAVSDAEVFSARLRITNGSRDPKDKALVDRYLSQQNGAKKPTMFSAPTWNGLGHHHAMNTGAAAWAAVNHAHHQTNHIDHSSETHIQKIEVHTSATDAKGIAADIGPALSRGQRAAKGQYGLA